MSARQPSEKYLVAFSFAGEERVLVRTVAEEVEKRLGPNTVFLDEWFEHWLAGSDADQKLQRIYSKGCSLAVVCISGAYGRKPWARAEHAAVRSRVIQARTAVDECERSGVLPIRVGDGEVEGILFTDMVPDVRGRAITKIAELVVDRLRLVIPDLKTIPNDPPVATSALGLNSGADEIGSKEVSILKLELEVIDKFLAPAFTEESNMMQRPSGEKRAFTGISLVEIPNLKMTMEAGVLLNLSDGLRTSAHALSTFLQDAEKYRRLAVPLLEHGKNRQRLDLFGMLYLRNLQAARNLINRIKGLLEAPARISC